MILYTTLTLLFGVIAAIETKCPSYIPVRECTCSTLIDASAFEFSTMTCKNLHSEDDIRTAVESTKGYPMFELQLIDCSFDYIPHDVFLGTTYQVISIKDSSIHSLSDTEIAFEGLENQLNLLEVVNCSYISNWEWSQLSNLVRVMEIHVSDTDLIDIANGVSRIQHIEVENFSFQKNHIKSLHDRTFAPFPKLEKLSLDDNHISELKRVMFPMPATSLKVLGLSHNLLDHLPDDLFVSMPALRTVYLSGNPLFTVSEDTFKPVWNQLKVVLLFATNLTCDCRLTWLTKADNSKKYVHALCESPARFRGRKLSTIRPNELWC